MTNLERIKNATDKELAKIIADEVVHGDCYGCPNTLRCVDCEEAWLAWLHDEHEEATE